MEDQGSSAIESDGEEEVPIRERLSHMTLEELQQLKEKLGTKIFDEAMFGSQHTKKKSSRQYSDMETEQNYGRRVRHNKPLEMSSKVRPRRLLPVVKPIEKSANIDPRFDPLYGTFDSEEFSSRYSFIEKKKKKELVLLQNQLDTETDLKEKKRIDFVVKKMGNELREAERVREKKKKDENIHKEAVKALKCGKKPVYFNKSELRTMELVEKFERVKKDNKVFKSIVKQRQKNATKNRKKIDVKGLSGV